MAARDAKPVCASLPSDVWGLVGTYLADDPHSLVRLTGVCRASRVPMRANGPVRCVRPPPALLECDTVAFIESDRALREWLLHPRRVCGVSITSMTVNADLAPFSGADIRLWDCDVVSLGAGTLRHLQLSMCRFDVRMPSVETLEWDGEGGLEALIALPDYAVTIANLHITLKRAPSDVMYQFFFEVTGHLHVKQEHSGRLEPFLLRCCELTAVCEDRSLSTLVLALAPDLQHLTVERFCVSGLAMPQLRTCTLRRCTMEGIDVQGCACLQHLHLSDVLWWGPLQLANMAHLLTVKIVDCMFVGDDYLIVRDNPLLHTVIAVDCVVDEAGNPRLTTLVRTEEAYVHLMHARASQWLAADDPLHGELETSIRECAALHTIAEFDAFFSRFLLLGTQ